MHLFESRLSGSNQPLVGSDGLWRIQTPRPAASALRIAAPIAAASSPSGTRLPVMDVIWRPGSLSVEASSTWRGGDAPAGYFQHHAWVRSVRPPSRPRVLDAMGRPWQEHVVVGASLFRDPEHSRSGSQLRASTIKNAQHVATIELDVPAHHPRCRDSGEMCASSSAANVRPNSCGTAFVNVLEFM